ncbi:hypothetical protein ACWPKS_16675 [Coraliomargarita sp. W4R72]
MAFLKKLRLSILLELFFDATLLLVFIAQAFVVGCLLIYGYLPLPAEWGNQIIAQQLPSGIILKVEEFRLRIGGSIDLVGIELRSNEIQQTLLDANVAEVELQWRGFTQLPIPEDLVVSGGTLYIPSVYSSDGHRSPLLERIAFRLRPELGNWNVDQFAALHNSIRLRGSFELPAKKEGPSSDLNVKELIQGFYAQVAKLSQLDERISDFRTPTIAFKFSSIDTHTQQIDLHVSSRRLQHPEIHAERIQLRGTIQIQDGEIIPLTAPRLTATHLEVPKYHIAAEGLSAEFPRETLNGLLAGHWPKLNLAAQRIEIKDFELDAPTLQIDPHAYPDLSFHGATRSLNGAIDFNGRINANTQSGHVRARGSVDLSKLTPDMMREKLPTIAYDAPPYLDVNLNFDEGFTLNHADLNAQVTDLKIDELTFDHINAHASYKDGLYTIEDLYLRRNKQWIDLTFSLDAKTSDYRATLIGTAVPYEYNALLPHWWEAIFRQFDFSQTDYSLGDFIIYGNTKRKSSDLYYGHAEAHKVSYMGVAVDDAELIVRGRGPYCELHDLNAHSDQGWARGDIAFASRTGDGKGPVSIRLDMEAKLTLEDAARLFKGDVANIIGDFKTEALPVIKLNGAIFNHDYPEYAGKSFFDLSAALDESLTFKDVPLEYLSFDLYGRSEVTHLRNVEMGYADGQAHAQIDVFTPSGSKNTLRYQFTLKDASQTQALRNLPQLNELESSLESTEQTHSTQSEQDLARVDMKVHGQGPVEDPFKHTGFGRFEIRNEKLGTIQLLGPLSKILQSTYFSFTSFNLNQMHGDFHYENETVSFDPLRIDGARTQINAPGTLRLSDQAINMQVDVSLFRNTGNPESNLRKISDLLIKQLPNLLEFELTGTLKKQKLRSLYDPRNLIPLFE